MYTLYYFDQYSWRYKPSKIHQNPGFIAALLKDLPKSAPVTSALSVSVAQCPTFQRTEVL